MRRLISVFMPLLLLSSTHWFCFVDLFSSQPNDRLAPNCHGIETSCCWSWIVNFGVHKTEFCPLDNSLISYHPLIFVVINCCSNSGSREVEILSAGAARLLSNFRHMFHFFSLSLMSPNSRNK
uniref:Secreted protein n=1 Tax=Parascaris univalens TaxID=6257 RepID=A0A915AEW1_PARUN